MTRPIDEILNSVEKHRDVSARFYKPAILWCATALVEREHYEPSELGPELLIEEFKALVEPFSSERSENGWMPLWHMKNDGAWSFFTSDKKIVEASVYAMGKPKTRKQFDQHIYSLAMNKQLAAALSLASGRAYLRSRIISMLVNDDENESSLFADYLTDLSDPVYLDEREWAADDLISLEAIESHRRTVIHKRIERRRGLPDEVKAIQGYECGCCGFDFEKTYGVLGRNYIEAHHVSPVSNHVGETRKLKLDIDFVVLCANCHRMIHRMGPPWGRGQIDELKKLIAQKT